MVEEQVRIGRRTFTFQLNRKSILLGEHEIDNWWFPSTMVFNQRQSRSRNGNHRQLLEAAWVLLLRLNRRLHRDEFEAYVLASLLPLMRSQGSRRISDDAIPTSRGVAGVALRRTIVAELDAMLGHGVAPMTALEFSRRTGDITGPTIVLSEDEQEQYQQLTRDLFGTLPIGRRSDPEDHVHFALAKWQEYKKTFSRKGREQERFLLDLISYEARAAMVAWYSDVWEESLLPHLHDKYRLNDATLRFLRFWHVEKRWPSNELDGHDFHLFHGHVFALHPACPLLIESAVGRELIGRWVSNDTVDPNDLGFQSVLGGLYLSMFQYDQLRRDAKERRPGPRSSGHSVDELKDSKMSSQDDQ